MIDYMMVLCTIYRITVAIPLSDGYKYEYQVDEDNHDEHVNHGEIFGHKIKEMLKVPLPESLVLSVPSEDSGYISSVYMQKDRIEKGGGKKHYRIHNMPSDIYTTTYPRIIMDTTVIPSPDTVTAPAQFMAYQGYQEEKDEYEVNMLNSINEISDFQEHIDSSGSVKVIPSPEIVTRPSTFKSFARK